MAKKNKTSKKTALSMRAVELAPNISELTPPLSPPLSTTLPENEPSLLSLPGSPGAKVISSHQPSPTLSASFNNPLHQDFNPFLIPPLQYHSNAEQDLEAQGNWDHDNQQTAKRKTKTKSKRDQKFLQQSSQRLESQHSREQDPGSRSDSSSNKQDQASSSEQAEGSISGDSTHTEAKELEPSNSKSESGAAPVSSETTEEQSQRPLKASDSSTANKSVVPEKVENIPVESSAGKDSNAVHQPVSTHYYPPPASGYYPHPSHYSQYLPRLPRSMSYQQGYPYSMPPPRNSSPYQAPSNNYPGPYSPFGNGQPMQRHDSLGSRGSNHGDPGPMPPMPPGENSSVVEEDPADLWARVSSVLPDIHLLINQHKSTHEGLSLREQLIRKEKAESAEAAKNKDEYINRLMRQLQEVEDRNASEASKYRLHIGNLEDKRKELEEKLFDAELGRKAAHAMNKQLSDEKAALLQERMALAQAATEEKDRVVKEFEEWKIKASELLEAEKRRTTEEKVRLMRDLEDMKMAALEAQKIALGKEIDDKLKEQGQVHQIEKATVIEDFSKEKDDLRASFLVQKKEIETNFESMRKDFESKLNSTQADLEKAIKTEREGREQWTTERETLTNSLEKQRENFDQEVEAKRQILIAQYDENMAGLARKHKVDLNEQMLGFVSLQEGINKKMTTENVDLRQGIASLKKAWDQDKEKFEGIVKELGGVAEALDSEKG